MVYKELRLRSDVRKAKKAGGLERVAAQSKQEDMPADLKRNLEVARQMVDCGSPR